AVLGDRLGDDPNRDRGPVYVMSAKPGTRDTEWGLSRLGSYPPGGGTIDIANAPLTNGDEPVAHVAGGYRPLETTGPPLRSGVAPVGEVGLRLHGYTSITGAIRMAVKDALSGLREHGAPKGGEEGEPTPWLRPRDDVHHGFKGNGKPEDDDKGHPGGLAGVI